VNIFDLITRANEHKIRVKQGHISLVGLAQSIRTDESLSDDEIAARALAVTLVKSDMETAF
jgi:hypothetical protein